jgi:hypothetical protein
MFAAAMGNLPKRLLPSWRRKASQAAGGRAEQECISLHHWQQLINPLELSNVDFAIQFISLHHTCRLFASNKMYIQMKKLVTTSPFGSTCPSYIPSSVIRI